MEIFQEVPARMADYTLYEDPGHAWLAVPMTEIEELGVEITPYSYQSLDGQTVFLEEDCDLSTFLRAREARNAPVLYRVILSETAESFVRRLPHYGDSR